MRAARSLIVVALSVRICLGAPEPPTAATVAFLGQHPDRKGLVQQQKLVSLYGLPLAVRDPQIHASTDAFVAAFIADQANCDALGVDGLTLEFRDKVTSASNRFTVNSYSQRMSDLPVHGSSVRLVVHHVAGAPTPVDKISHIGIRLTPNPETAFPPDTVTSEQALTAAQASPEAVGLTSFSTPEKVVYEQADGTIHRAWRIRGQGELKAVLLFVNAAAGQVLDVLDLSADADVSGKIYGVASQGVGGFDAQSPHHTVVMPRINVSLTGQPDAVADPIAAYAFTGLPTGTPVDVSSTLTGQWATVRNLAPCTSTLTSNCSPTGAYDLFAVEEDVTPPEFNVDLIFSQSPQLPVDPSPLFTGQINTYLAITRGARRSRYWSPSATPPRTFHTRLALSA